MTGLLSGAAFVSFKRRLFESKEFPSNQFQRAFNGLCPLVSALGRVGKLFKACQIKSLVTELI
jgi:hypothetical protein